MGMYTQLHLGVRLKKNLGDANKDIINFMLGEQESEPVELPQHELFNHSRWQYMLQCDSYYFEYKTTHLFKYDEIGDCYWFNVTCNLKNYENEIELFLNWLLPYIEEEHCMIGYFRYEENSMPAIITLDSIRNKSYYYVPDVEEQQLKGWKT